MAIPPHRLFALAVAFAAALAHAEVRVTDGTGAAVALPAPARRIVSLAPHATELLFAAGAGDRIVGAVEYSDHPEAAKSIPRVGDATMLDLERIATLRPDLIVAWKSGTPERHLAALARLGVPVYSSQPVALDDIARDLERLGRLADTATQANAAAEDFRRRHEALRQRYASRPTVTVFLQVWEQPLLTVSGKQPISDALRTCGGRNVFDAEKLLVPTVDPEAVVRANPDAIVATGRAGDEAKAFATWRRLPAFGPTARGNLVLIESDALGRASPRILEATAMLCEALEGVRARRGRG